MTTTCITTTITDFYMNSEYHYLVKLDLDKDGYYEVIAFHEKMEKEVVGAPYFSKTFYGRDAYKRAAKVYKNQIAKVIESQAEIIEQDKARIEKDKPSPL